MPHHALQSSRQLRLHARICKHELPAGRRLFSCRAQNKSEFNGTRFNLEKAAKEFLAGLERGEDEEDLIARQLGAAKITQLTELQEKYAEKVKEKLLERVAQMKKEKDEASFNFTYGKRAYESGDYFVAEKLLEKATRELGMYTMIGGEAAMWLAMTYSALGREAECCDLYRQLEEGHPSRKVQKQAAYLRYIEEAPKLKLGEDEKVKIPLLTDVETKRRTGKALKKYAPTGGTGRPIQKSYLDDFLDFKPPAFLPPNRYVQVAFAVLLLGTTFYLNYKYSRGEL